MDVAPIDIDTSLNVVELECNMPIFGTQIFKFFKPQNEWFLQYEQYPIVRVSVGADLYAGINDLPYQIKILPTTGYKEELNANNITNFWVGMIKK